MKTISKLSAYRPILHPARFTNPSTIRHLSDARARFIDPSITHGPQERDLDIYFGGPKIASIIIEPAIASKLVARQFAEGEKAEVPLIFFHKTRHFAKDEDAKSSKLYIDQDLESNISSDGISSPAIMFRYGINSTLAIKGSTNGKLMKHSHSPPGQHQLTRIVQKRKRASLQAHWTGLKRVSIG
ncbi:MAG: hypothetical protein Q9168_006136 [Polycauliona sp. 1 TL-2023]